MKKLEFIILCLGACLIAFACPSKRSAPGPDKAAALRNRIEYISSLMDERGLAARVMSALSGALPESAWLTEVAYDGEKAQARGYAPSNTVVADYIARLGGSPVLAEVSLQASVQRRIRNRDWQEFSVQAAVRGARARKAEAEGGGAGAGSEDIAALTARLAELERSLTRGKDSAGILRQFQTAANESGLKIAKFAQGAEVPREFYREWPISLEVAGSRRSFGAFLESVGEMPGPWVVRRFSLKTASPQDEDSQVRASLTAQTCLSK